LALLGPTSVKAARKMLMKMTPGGGGNTLSFGVVWRAMVPLQSSTERAYLKFICEIILILYELHQYLAKDLSINDVTHILIYSDPGQFLVPRFK